MLLSFVVMVAFPALGLASTIVDTEADFSLLGQGINGIQYGYYDTGGLTGNFSTAGMYVNPLLSKLAFCF